MDEVAGALLSGAPTTKSLKRDGVIDVGDGVDQVLFSGASQAKPASAAD
jgi:predicted P-loop ATPase/GTPase